MNYWKQFNKLHGPFWHNGKEIKLIHWYEIETCPLISDVTEILTTYPNDVNCKHCLKEMHEKASSS